MCKKIILIGNIASMLINFRQELIMELVKQGFKVYCFAYGYTEREKQKVISWGATPKEHYLNPNGMNPFSDLKGVYRLFKDIKKISPDVVFNTFIKPVIFGTMVAKFAKVPRVVGMIEGLGNAFVSYPEGQKVKSKLLKFIQVILYKIAIPRLDHVIFLNPDDKKDLVQQYFIRAKKLTILGGIGVDLEKFYYREADTNKPVGFIFVARLLREKGIFEFFESAKVVKELYPNTDFTILGGFDEKNPFSPSKDSLNSCIRDEIINYLGYMDNVSDVIADSSVFVLPSYREGVPRSTQEAMAIGRPIITTDVPGCRETVVDGINGFLIPPHSPEKLAKKMLYFVENPNQINVMGRESRLMAEKQFNIKEVNRKLIAIILGSEYN